MSEFNLNHENSAKMFVTVVTADGEEIKQWGTKHLKRGEVPAKYIFETEEHGTFSVEPKAVN